MITYDKNEIREYLNLEDIYNLVQEWGGEPEYTDFGILSTTICHNLPGEGSKKLYFYENSGLFRCYTGCNSSFDVFELTIKVFEIQFRKKIDLNDAVRFIAAKHGIAGRYEDVDTGAYEIYVIPGQYDIELVSPGFLDTIYTNINIQEGDEKDFGNEILTPGDVNHDGVISVKDVQLIQAMMDATIGDGIYEEEKDIGNKGFIGVGDLVYIQKNMDELMNIK